MKIAFFDDRYHEVYGHNINLAMAARTASAAGHDVIFCTTAEGALASYVRSEGTTVRVAEAPATLRRFEKALFGLAPVEKARAAADLVRYSVRLHRTLRACDIVFVSSVRSSLLLFRTRLARRPRVILYAQNSVYLGGYAAAALVGVDRIALISDGALATFPGWITRAYRRRLDRLPTARDLGRFESLAPDRRVADDAPLRLLAICLIEERKGIDVVVQAMAHAARRGVRTELNVVGGTKGARSERYLESLKALAGELSVTVRYAGYADDVVPHLAAADVFVLGSHAEGQPGVLLEAMACALPCVVTDVGGCGEIVADGTTGRVVPAAAPEAFGDALVELSDDAVRRRYGEAGRERVIRDFSLAAYERNLLGLLERTASAGTASVPTA